MLTYEALQHITCMHIDGAQRDQLLAVQLAQVTVDQLNESTQLGDLRPAASTGNAMLCEQSARNRLCALIDNLTGQSLA